MDNSLLDVISEELYDKINLLFETVYNTRSTGLNIRRLSLTIFKIRIYSLITNESLFNEDYYYQDNENSYDDFLFLINLFKDYL